MYEVFFSHPYFRIRDKYCFNLLSTLWVNFFLCCNFFSACLWYTLFITFIGLQSLSLPVWSWLELSSLPVCCEISDTWLTLLYQTISLCLLALSSPPFYHILLCITGKSAVIKWNTMLNVLMFCLHCDLYSEWLMKSSVCTNRVNTH